LGGQNAFCGVGMSGAANIRLEECGIVQQASSGGEDNDVDSGVYILMVAVENV
jgi:hypothetical protein